MATKVVIISSGFPFGFGEQFLEEEVKFWAKSGKEIVIMPEKDFGSRARRQLPSEVKLDATLADRWQSFWWRLRAIIDAIKSSLWWNERSYVRVSHPNDTAALKYAFRSVVQVMMILRILKGLSRRKGKIDLVYPYWMSVSLVAAVLAKRQGYVKKVICRAHGTDLYEHIRPSQYAALIRQVAKDIDQINVISKDGARYLIEHYGFSFQQVQISRLGVKIPPETEISRSSDSDTLEIVSVSSISPIKRLDRVPAALALVKQRMPNLKIRWRHFGDGPLKNHIFQLSKTIMDMGVTVEFLGFIPNEKLLDWYSKNKVDLFINTSESEGIPVSIMEAMGRGIPAIAPDIGGVSEVVLRGWLIPKHPEGSHIASLIERHFKNTKQTIVRQRMRDRIIKFFNGDENYEIFVDKVLCLIERQTDEQS